jgi:hypothetical protein
MKHLQILLPLFQVKLVVIKFKDKLKPKWVQKEDKEDLDLRYF